MGPSIPSDNPLLPGIGMSDPHVRVFNGKLYLYSGHDHSPDDRDWVMRDWRIFSSTDLISWDHVQTIVPQGTYMEENPDDCWAGDAAQRNGKTYFYFSNRNRNIGVMAAEQPEGPFKDVLGGPLVRYHDPTILIDDDPEHTPYIVYSCKEETSTYLIARLNENMVSLAEKPRPLDIRGKGWEEAPEWMDKNFLFKYNGLYYLSWGSDYATSETVYGPYVWRGCVGTGYKLGPYAHGSFFEWKKQLYHIWCRYLRDGYKFRECLMTYCHTGEDGELSTDTRFLDRHFPWGVGRYDASWPRIEAEWFTAASVPVTKRRLSADNWEVCGLGNGARLTFAKVDFGSGCSKITICGNAEDPKASIELYAEASTDKPLCRIPITGAVSDTEGFPKLSGVQDITIRCNTAAQSTLSLDWIRFH